MEDDKQNEQEPATEPRITVTIGFTPSPELIKALEDVPSGSEHQHATALRGLLARHADISLDNMRIIALSGGHVRLDPDDGTDPNTLRTIHDMQSVGKMFEKMITGHMGREKSGH